MFAGMLRPKSSAGGDTVVTNDQRQTHTESSSGTKASANATKLWIE